MQPFGSPTQFPLNIPTGESTQGGPNESANLIPAGTTTTQTAIPLGNPGWTKLLLTINVTAAAGSLTVTVNGLSSPSGYSYTILTSAALGVGTTTLAIAPGLAGTANVNANTVLPRYLTVTATVTTGATYGIDYELAP